MPATPLHDALAAAGARFGQFGGAETAANFGDVAKEYAALRTGAGVYDLRRAMIRVSGNDRVRWLNGMVTNNIRDLKKGDGNYNFLLNAQGHILADMYVYNRGEHFLVDTGLEQAQRVMELFDQYIIMDEVEVADISERLAAIGVMGPATEQALPWVEEEEWPEKLQMRDLHFFGGGYTSLVVKDNPVTREVELWVPPEQASFLWEGLMRAEATPVGYEALELARVAAGIPRFGVDIREKDLPQETAQQRALNFNKGCYLGQEIVERIHARGAVHRTLAGFELQGAAAPGAKISSGGKEVGQVTSVAQLPNGAQRTLALGYVRRESALPGTEVEIEGATAKVSALPFADRGTE